MRRLVLRFCGIACACVLLAPVSVWSQEKPVEEFNKAFEAWKVVLNRVRDIQREYKVAKPDQRLGLEKEFNDKLAEAWQMLPALRKVAEAAYVADPKQADIADLLATMSFSDLEADDFREAARLARLLIENKYENTEIFGVAGKAAFYLGELDDAEKYLKLAGDKNAEGLRQGEGNLLPLITKERALWEEELKARAAEDKPDGDPEALPRVLLKTTKGDIAVELFENEAPNTVANFISLVEGNAYDDNLFHRVIEHFVAQTGDRMGTGRGGPGYTIKCECNKPNHRKHFLGSLSMAHQGVPDTGGSQFYINFTPARHLDGHHTVFGRVISGFEVLPKLTRRDPESANPPAADKVISATVLRKRSHPYVPEKVTTPSAQPKPGDNKPGEAKPTEAKPTEAKPGEAKPGETKSPDAKNESGEASDK